MTPKEKARELVLKFYDYTIQESWQSKNYFAIECALIAVDEIVLSHTYGLSPELKTYWQEVKQEIEQL